MPRRRAARQPKTVATIRHKEASRPNIPTAEHQPVMTDDEQRAIPVAYPRNTDLDPQLVWRGKDAQDQADLTAHAPPLYIQEKVHPKALINDLVASSQRSVASRQETRATGDRPQATQLDLFADFNGLPEDADRTEFYQHEGNWSNRMILGDSLQVMASLAEREGLRGKVQCIYLDPPYGIKFNSNFQWSTTSRDVRDGNAAHVTREPEQVKAFRDTWRDGIHSYLSYLRDRLTVARDLLAESGSIFVQIGDENVHRVRTVMDEVFGEENFVSQITFTKTTGFPSRFITNVSDAILWYGKAREQLKFRQVWRERVVGRSEAALWRPLDEMRGVDGHPFVKPTRLARSADLTSPGASARDSTLTIRGKTYLPLAARHWRTHPQGLRRLDRAWRTIKAVTVPSYLRFFDDFPMSQVKNVWDDTTTGGFGDERFYVVQTITKVIQRCILMTTDPGDLVLDPTCGSGTTAYVAEQWGRRWITIDTSRVALALARARIMGARYPYYLLTDSKAGQEQEAKLSRRLPSEEPTYGDIRQGFVYQRVPHITLRAIANNAEIDVIWEQYERQLAPLREQLSVVSGAWSVASGPHPSPPPEQAPGEGTPVPPPQRGDHRGAAPLEEWEVPRERPDDWPAETEPLLAEFWELRIARQREIDASIAAKADYEYLYDQPYEDRKTVRVAGPFTVESISPHRTLTVDADGEFIAEAPGGYGSDFATVILDNLKTAGVQQAHKEDRIEFTSLTPWPGHLICAEGQISGQSPVVSDQRSRATGDWLPATDLATGDRLPATDLATGDRLPATENRCAIFIGPEFGTVSRPDLVEAAREAAEAGFDLLIACAFNYDAHSTEFERLGRIPVLKARMNNDLHMANDLKNTGQGNLFVIFGEPDISVACGQWLVASGGKKVGNYEQVKELSGLGSLEEINRVGRDGLSRLCAVSTGGKVRPDQPDSAGGSVGSSEHRGGGGAPREQGVSSVSGDSQRFAGGDGDLSDPGTTAGDGYRGGDRSAAGTSVGRWSDAQRSQTLAAVQSLISADFPLTLTTDHWLQATVHGVDVFHPNTGEVRSDGPEGIACWFIDTDYNEESFFVRHAYFLGASDPYKSLKTTLKAEINAEAWETLKSDTSRPFPRPESGRIAVKVINHLGDEVMKVFRV